MFQELKNPKNFKLPDMNLREMITMVPMIILVFWIGLYPQPFLKTFDASVTHLITKVSPDNFRPSKNQEHHTSLIKQDDLAKLTKQLQGKNR